MTTKQSLSGVGFTRCAVCKIDLKGRFVYLDEKVEVLLGYTKEELFGKSLLDFLDEPSQQMVNSLLAQRNHYETFYDTTSITVYNRSREALAMRAVVSLNFIAGNPVNYQLIIDCAEEQTPSRVTSGESDNFEAVVKELVRISRPAGWKDYLQVICRFVGASRGCVYLIHEESLQPRSAVDRNHPGEFGFSDIPEAAALHRHVARSGEEYSFVDGNAVQRVIEQGGTAPNEYVARLDVADDARFLVRLLFPDDFDPHKIQADIALARTSLQLAARMVGAESSTAGQDDDGNEVKFTIGFLDSLNIAAFLADSEGTVVGYNPAALQIFDERQLEGSYLEAINSLQEYNSPGFTEPIVDYINSSVEDELSLDKLVLSVKSSGSSQARLTVLKLGDEPGDLSGCFVFEPGSAGVLPTDTSDQWMPILTGLARRLKGAEDTAHKFSHEFFNRLDEKGNERLTELSLCVRRLRGLVSELHRYARLSRPTDPPRLIDLNLLIAELMEKLRSDHCDVKINCSYKDLPKIVTQPKLLSQALRGILDNGITYNDSPAAEIKVKAVSEEGRCLITVSDKGFGISPRHLPEVFDLLYRSPDKKVQTRDGHGVGLAIARKAVRLLGGEIDISSKVGEGTVVTLTIPLE